ncbi:MAG: flagellar basal body rod protein FlgC [Phycisphaerales bacterium]|nr:flagellar basal body rod protein FlgC [Phycisphaerales bacterium]
MNLNPMYGTLDISTSGLIAQRTRLQSISANIANQDTYADASGRNVPFARRVVYFAPGDPNSRNAETRRLGVHVASIGQDRSHTFKWDPDNPLADQNGYIKYPDINPTFEMINYMEASRAYEANLVAAEASKTMMAQALRLLA